MDDELIEHEIDAMYVDRARRVAQFHSTLREAGVGRFLAGVLTLVETVGYHVPWPARDRD